jgi:glycosyltransferase involved in cell wall biosynthesis
VARQLTERGHQVHVLTSNYRADQIQPPEPAVARILHLESPDHVHYQLHYSLEERWREQQNQQHVAQVVTSHKPDIIFINGMWNLPHAVAQQAERLCPNRVVYYIASYWPTELDAHQAYWQSPTTVPQFRPLKRWLGGLVSRTLLTSVPRNQLAFAHVLCVSAFVQNYMTERAGVPQAQTRVVYNGIDPETFALRDLADNVPVLRLLYAGRIAPAKGVHTAIEGLGCVLKLQPEASVNLSVVGTGAPGYELELKQLVERLGLSHAVQFWGQVPRRQMPEILAEHDVLLLPSIWPEPLARMTQEAMASGLVVIGTETGGTPEILEDGLNGLTFEAGKAAMLAEKISRIAGDSELRVRLARAARQTIEDRFTFDRMVDEIEYYLTVVVDHKEQVIE